MAGNYLEMSRYSGGQTNNQLVSQSNMNKAQGLSELAGIMGSYGDYRLQRRMTGFAKVQAKEIEVNAQERANQLRESFARSLGNHQVATAQRGFTQNSGSVRAERELSAKNLGEDVAKMKQNAKSKSTALKAQAQLQKNALSNSFMVNTTNSLIKAGMSFAGGGA